MSQSASFSEFFSDIPDRECFSILLDRIPNSFSFVKDLESRFVFGSQSLLQKLDLSDLSELVGTTDRDYFPDELCQAFLTDDQLVFSSGEPILDRVELGFAGASALDWYLTSKIPLFDESNQIKGLIGVTRVCPYPVTEGKLAKLVNWLKSNHHYRVTTGEMARQAGVSPPVLRKLFQETFGVTPQDFELTSRIKAASRQLVNSSKNIAEIAIDFGFYDQSAFTNQFKKRIGLTPKEFRNRGAKIDAN